MKGTIQLSFCKFLKILMVSDKQFTRHLEFIKLFKQNPSEKFSVFIIYQNYTLAFRPHQTYQIVKTLVFYLANISL